MLCRNAPEINKARASCLIVLGLLMLSFILTDWLQLARLRLVPMINEDSFESATRKSVLCTPSPTVENVSILEKPRESEENKSENLTREKSMKEVWVLPGVEDVSAEEAYRTCRVNRETFKKHFTDHLCLHAYRYNFIMIISPKASSSTIRVYMKKYFGSRELKGNECSRLITTHPKLKVYAVIRDPVARFFSGYNEMMHHSLDIDGINHIPKEIRGFIEPLRNLSRGEYRSFQNTEKGSKVILKVFKDFLEVYDYKHVFDIHMRLQTALLYDKDGKFRRVDRFFHTENLEKELLELGDAYHVSIPQEIKKVYHNKSPLNIENMSQLEMEKICRNVLLDLCCLSFPLPDSCKRVENPLRLTCKISIKNEKKSVEPALGLNSG